MKYQNILTKKLLIKEYIQNKKSTYKIAEKIGCNYSTIRSYLIKYNILRRTISEAIKELFKDSKNWPFYGRHHTEETKTKISKFLKGNSLTEEHKKNIGKSCQGINLGKKNGMFGKTIKQNRIYYKNICMKSSWEVKFAHFLDLSNIEFLYESKTFDLGDTTYTPDFYIPEWDLYIEIKGWWRREAKKKFRLFKKLYPSARIKVLMQKDLQKLEIL